MPSVEQAFAWLIALPPLALYGAAFGFAFAENLFPPAPADVFIGLSAFIAARNEASITLVLLSALVGNAVSAAITFELGRRYGAAGVRRRMEERGWQRREQKLEGMYARYGLLALFLGRLVPGVRAIVPVLAGALQVSAVKAGVVIVLAATLWYGMLTALAYRLGVNWQEYAHELAAIGRWSAGAGLLLAVLVVAAVIWFFRKRAHRD